MSTSITRIRGRWLRIGRESTMKDTPQLRGALDRVSHLVEEVKD